MNSKTVISPSDPQYDTSRLSEIFMEIDGFKSPSGKKWLVNYQKLVKFPFSKVDDLSEEEIEHEFNKILDSFSPIIQRTPLGLKISFHISTPLLLISLNFEADLHFYSTSLRYDMTVIEKEWWLTKGLMLLRFREFQSHDLQFLLPEYPLLLQ